MVLFGCPHPSALLAFSVPAALGPSGLAGAGCTPATPCSAVACCPACALSLGQTLPAQAMLSTKVPGHPRETHCSPSWGLVTISGDLGVWSPSASSWGEGQAAWEAWSQEAADKGEPENHLEPIKLSSVM